MSPQSGPNLSFVYDDLIQLGFATSILEINARAQRHFLDKEIYGRIELAPPEQRKGSYFPSFLEPRRAVERALVAVF